MKNKKLYYIIIIMILIVIIMITRVLKYNILSIDNKIINKTWYRYNYNNGIYETLYISNGKINYFKPTSTNNTNSLDNCTKYYFNKKNNVLKLDCDKEIKVISVSDKVLSIDFDKKNEKYFVDINDSLNYEFESYYKKSMIDYKKEKEQVKELSKINAKKLLEVFKEKEYSKIVFISDKCTSVECSLVLDIMEKWISTNENIYFFDSKELNNNIINYINKLNNSNYDYSYFNGIYPRIIVSNNNKIIEQYELKCSGFNCTKYYKNEF